ncbi:uncharacterized protein LACBIDRAFT_296896 [Laccaria bicolor S238N-H82]|uniref:Predicted protein n=1 Tax=Laccaria bicolor (strain S238N-H82 / ATCC MYA-4686) TaxID=486041 RepID=B0D9I5_LACBS|nr:uncharacterized protein LACBIDRAFT_296896 [Laccaria bicolor S238N-H82]EDR08358.1 predicted protein [Laccaria bicolor S238N-H82]|eukprot:XP_001880583.1 predicted protein [Laccaria bicolor S238N-H82]
MVNLYPLTESHYDSASPYPPTTDSDSDCASEPSNLGLRTSIAAVPEAKLRAILLKLADSNPRFHRAIIKEVAAVLPFNDSPPTTPTMARHRRPRRKSRRESKTHGMSHKAAHHDERRITVKEEEREVSGYHPGHLENEVYEFLSRTPDGLAFKVVRTITMWSCCDEDQWSPGCVAIPPPASDGGIGRRSSEGFLADVFPDSVLEVYGDHTTTPKTARPSFRAVTTD